MHGIWLQSVGGVPGWCAGYVTSFLLHWLICTNTYIRPELHDQTPDKHHAQEPHPSPVHYLSNRPDLPTSNPSSALPHSFARTDTVKFHCTRIFTYAMHMRRCRLALSPVRLYPPQQRCHIPPGMGLAHALQHLSRWTGNRNRRGKPGRQMWSRRGLSRCSGDRA